MHPSYYIPSASGGEKSNVSTIKVKGISVGCGANMTENRACPEDSPVSTAACWNITATTGITEECLTRYYSVMMYLTVIIYDYNS